MSVPNLRAASAFIKSKISVREVSAHGSAETLPRPENDPARTSNGIGDKTVKEWKPVMLRKGPAALLVLTCWAFLGLLEALQSISHKRQGFPIASKSSVQAARYIPVIGIIGLAFAWRTLVQDLKIVTPYSVMSKRWVESRKGVLLDYLGAPEFKSVWTSIRHRHGAMFFGLLGALLCGFLVPLATSLTFVDLHAPIRQISTIDISSKFSFSDTLASKNGTLYIPWDYRGNQPFASVILSLQPNGDTAPWTVNEYAFDSFDISRWLDLNATVSAKSQAFSAPFDCTRVNYVANATEYVYELLADKDDLADAKCLKSFKQTTSLYNEAGLDYGWLNMTDCSNDGTDIRMLATVVSRPSADKPDIGVVGVICRPQYFIRDAQIQVNGSNGDILSFDFQGLPQPINVGADLPVMVAYLNNPLDPTTQQAYLLGESVVFSKFGTFFAGRKPQATFENVTLYADEYKSRDVFFDQLFNVGRTSEEYIKNPALLESDVPSLSNALVTQIISSFSRINTTIPTSGIVTVYEPRLRVRDSSLRTMQGILGFMGLIVALCCTILRPRSCLTEDPSKIAAMSVILSASGNVVEGKLQELTTSDLPGVITLLRGWKWRLSRSQKGTCMIEAEEATRDSPRSQSEKPEHQPALVKGERLTKGFQPLPFRVIFRLVLILLLCAAIIALIVLMKLSNARDGFQSTTRTPSAAWSLVPATLLVILGYVTSSVYGMLQRVTPYLELRKTSGSKTMLHSLFRSDLHMPFHAILRFGSIALATGSIMALIFPAVKILTAGLYVPVASFTTQPVQGSFDTSLMDEFEFMYERFNSSVPDPVQRDTDIELQMVKRASQFTEWTSIPSFNVPRRSGALDTLVFSNLTGVEPVEGQKSLEGGFITARIPAIEARVTCTPLGPEHFQVYVSENSGSSSGDSSFRFDTSCTTRICNETFGEGSNSFPFWTKSSKPGSTSNRFFGMANVDGNYLYSPTTSFDTPYIVTLGDFPAIKERFTNISIIPEGWEGTKLEPGMFNMSALPQIVAVVCNKEYWEVEVDVQLTQRTGQSIRPWAVSSYDNSTIKSIKQYRKDTPLWLYPKSNYPDKVNDDANGIIDNDIIWPARGDSRNFFQLLAAYQEFQVGNLDALMNVTQLTAAAKYVFTSYCLEILTELRPYALQTSKKGPLTVSGTVSTPSVRMKQDLGVTIALCVLLIAILAGLVYIYLGYPRERFLTVPPTSIAAQMSMLAGSSLVQNLREGDVKSVADTDIWNNRFRLGWWPAGMGQNGGVEGWRYGIDVVKGEDGPHDTHSA